MVAISLLFLLFGDVHKFEVEVPLGVGSTISYMQSSFPGEVLGGYCTGERRFVVTISCRDSYKEIEHELIEKELFVKVNGRGRYSYQEKYARDLIKIGIKKYSSYKNKIKNYQRDFYYEVISWIPGKEEPVQFDIEEEDEDAG